MAKDPIGNEIKPGMFVIGHLEGNFIMQVVDVKEPSTMGLSRNPRELPMQVPGQIVVQVILPLEFAGGQPVGGVWVVKQPKEEPISSAERNGNSPVLVS